MTAIVGSNGQGAPEAQEAMQEQLMVRDLLSLELAVSVAQAVLAVLEVAEMAATVG